MPWHPCASARASEDLRMQADRCGKLWLPRENGGGRACRRAVCCGSAVGRRPRLLRPRPHGDPPRRAGPAQPPAIGLRCSISSGRADGRGRTRREASPDRCPGPRMCSHVNWALRSRRCATRRARVCSPSWLHSADVIDVDVDLREVRGQAGVDVLCALLRAIGRRLGKPVLMSRVRPRPPRARLRTGGRPRGAAGGPALRRSAEMTPGTAASSPGRRAGHQSRAAARSRSRTAVTGARASAPARATRKPVLIGGSSGVSNSTRAPDANSASQR